MKPKRVLAINTPWLLQCTICSPLQDVDFHYDSWDWKMAQKGSCFILSYAFLLRNFLRLPASLRLPFRSHTFAILDFFFRLAASSFEILAERRSWEQEEMIFSGRTMPYPRLKSIPRWGGRDSITNEWKTWITSFCSFSLRFLWWKNIKAEFLWYRFVRAFYGHFKGAL